jgi:hypothetical protein
MGAPALPPLGIALRLAKEFNGMVVEHCCPFGSLADIEARPFDVRFSPESGHC